FQPGFCNLQACFANRRCWQPPGFVGNQVVFGAQSYIYGLVHALNTYNGNSYVNPFYPAGLGTSLDELQAGLNLMDSPANAAGPHNYISYNVINQDWANRTMADGLAQLGIPSIAGVESGAHWVCVVGVRTDRVPVAGQAFFIFGFYIQDPWTGYWLQHPFDPHGNFINQPGFGQYKFCSTRINPLRLRTDADWFSLFDPAGGPPLPVYGSGLGYKFEVEPIGPVPLDTGNNGQYSSIPPPSPILTNAPLTAQAALAIATNTLATDVFIGAQAGFSNGTWNVSDAMMVQYPSDGTNQGDWLLPYEGSGGATNVTGFVMVDVQTGDIDEAVWMNPGDVVPSLTLAQVETMETDEFAGLFPNDNAGGPQLNLQLTGTNTAVLTWPASPLVSYSLQQNSSLTSSNWVTLTNSPTVVSNLNQVVLPASAAQSFFRLTSP
ncbi:MAG TPA: hypothetical protein VNX46_10255, partial [Candidatus Acidoferrum sp.]|nr:hypothetical protein [Candidatus Acidoferrum sp.]